MNNKNAIVHAIIVALITAVFGIMVFHNLGTAVVPRTGTVLTNGIVLDLGMNAAIRQCYHYGGIEEGAFTLSLSADGKHWISEHGTNRTAMFRWKHTWLHTKGRFVKLDIQGPVSILEIVLCDAHNRILTPSVIPEHYAALFDEQHTVAIPPTYESGMYFDEIYHARTAYELCSGIQPYYDTSHPPLGKLIIAAGIASMGMTPLSFRIPGALAAILMVPLMYIFTASFLRSRKAGILGALLFALEGFHLVHGRMATIDIFLSFFTVLSAFLFWKFFSGECTGRSVRLNIIWLAASGAAAGLAVSVKWSFMFTAAGFGLLFAGLMIRHLITGVRSGETVSRAVHVLILCASGMAAFILIPGIIYFISWLPVTLGGSKPVIRAFIDMQIHMLTYHSGLVDSHPFSSRFWQWPLLMKPIWYYENIFLKQEFLSVIWGMGNPVVWWGAFAGVAAAAVSAVRQRDERACFILAVIIASIAPWAFIQRISFLYHYLPIIPFAVLALAVFLSSAVSPPHRIAVVVYLVIAGAGLLLFYPILSGMVVPAAFTHALHWLPAWRF